MLYALNVHNCLCDRKIEVVQQHVYLGITVDNFFTWRPHISNLCNRLRSVCFQLFHLSYMLPNQVLKTVYVALVESLICYGILAWGNASSYHLNLISSLQYKMLKIITPKSIINELKSEPINLFKYNKLFPVTQMYKYKLILKFYFEPS